MERPTYLARDYGPREVDERAKPLVPARPSVPADLEVWAHADQDGLVFLQQGYDLITLDCDDLIALFALALKEAWDLS